MIDLGDKTTDLKAELAALVKRAKRDQHIARRFYADDPTPWDVTHAEMDDKLTALLGR